MGPGWTAIDKEGDIGTQRSSQGKDFPALTSETEEPIDALQCSRSIAAASTQTSPDGNPLPDMDLNGFTNTFPGHQQCSGPIGEVRFNHIALRG